MPKLGDLGSSELEGLLRRMQSVSRNLVGLTASALARFADGVTLAEYRVLVLLETGLAQTPSELADGLDITRPGVAQILRRLEAAKLVRRRQSRNDRRSFRLSATARGARIVDRVLAERERKFRPLLAELSVREQRDLLRALERLDRAFEGSDNLSTGRVGR